MLAYGLDKALRRAGIPILGVSIGVEADRATWAVHYTDSATAQQKTDGAAIVAAYQLAADTALVDELAAQQIDGLKAIKAAVICALWGRLGRQPTGAEINAERTRFLNIYKAL